MGCALQVDGFKHHGRAIVKILGFRVTSAPEYMLQQGCFLDLPWSAWEISFWRRIGVPK